MQYIIFIVCFVLTKICLSAWNSLQKALAHTSILSDQYVALMHPSLNKDDISTNKIFFKTHFFVVAKYVLSIYKSIPLNTMLYHFIVIEAENE